MFKSDFKHKLESGAEYTELVEFLRCSKIKGLRQREAYDQLEQLWLEYGFDNDGHEVANKLRDDLEYVMEIAWGYCASGAEVWDGSLSKTKNS